ncbi:MAG: hypothetical protein V3T72_05745 [Thermoanaerobaculia bacterium]
MTANPTDSAPARGDRPFRRPARWLPTRRVGVALLLCAVLVVYLQAGDATGDPGINNVLSMVLGALAIATLVLWFLLFSGQPRWIRLLPLAGVAAFVLLFGTFYRLEQVTGALIPKFVPRSTPVAVAPSAAAPASRPGAVDLVTTTAADFPQFLGRNRDLKVADVRLDRAAAMPPELVWRQPIGAGWSGFAVVNGYAVTMEQRGDEEPAQGASQVVGPAGPRR